MSMAYQAVIYVSTKRSDRPLNELNEELIRGSREDYGLIYEDETRVR